VSHGRTKSRQRVDTKSRPSPALRNVVKIQAPLHLTSQHRCILPDSRVLLPDSRVLLPEGPGLLSRNATSLSRAFKRRMMSVVDISLSLFFAEFIVQDYILEHLDARPVGSDFFGCYYGQVQPETFQSLHVLDSRIKQLWRWTRDSVKCPTTSSGSTCCRDAASMCA